jgi:putative DNA primase/helicase
MNIQEDSRAIIDAGSNIGKQVKDNKKVSEPGLFDEEFYQNKGLDSKQLIKPSNGTGESQKLEPHFDSLNNADTFVDHATKLVNNTKATPHNEILQQLLEQFEPLDFKALAFPQVEKLRKKLEQASTDSKQAKDIRKQLDKIKVNTKHYRILSIRNVSKTATKNRWGLCKNHDFIYLYNGTFWAEIDKDEFQKFLGEAAEKMGVSWDNAQDYQFREQLFKQFLATEHLSIPPGNNNVVLINLLNGTFEISPQGTKLRPFDRSDFITYQLPFEHNPQAKAPLFEAYLNRVLPDIERQRVLAEYLGFVFIKHGSNVLKEEKALILYGNGANGKSVFYDIVTAMLGSQNTSSFSLQELTNENGYYRAMIANKLINYASEINGKLETDIFKRLVSGEMLPARLPYGNPMQLSQYAKLIFNCNELPKDVEHTLAYFRRFLIIPFDVTIPEPEQDKQLSYKIIEEELSGVFNWVLQGLNRLLEQKRFSDCEAAKKALEQYKTESNSIKLFFEDNGYKNSSFDYELIKELYLEYRTYCNENGMAAFKKINFIKQLKILNVTLDREPGTGQNVAYLKKSNNSY